MNPGSIVRCRNRDWVLLPSEQPDVHLLRPLTGATDEVVAVHAGMSNLISGFARRRFRRRPGVARPVLRTASGRHGAFGCARIRNVVSSPFPVMSPFFLSGDGPRAAKA